LGRHLLQIQLLHSSQLIHADLSFETPYILLQIKHFLLLFKKSELISELFEEQGANKSLLDALRGCEGREPLALDVDGELRLPFAFSRAYFFKIFKKHYLKRIIILFRPYIVK